LVSNTRDQYFTHLEETWVFGSYVPPRVRVFPIIPSGDGTIGSLEDFPRAAVPERMIKRWIANDTKTVTFATRTSRRRHWSIVGGVVEVTLQLDGIQWGTSLQDGLAYIPWTLAPFGMIPIGPGSSSSEDRPTVIKITSLTHPLTHPSLTTPPPHRSFVSNIKTCDLSSD